MNQSRLTPGHLAQVACTLEVCARKPGNVHPGRGFDDVQLVDFLLSASAIAGPLDRARTHGVGASVLQAVKATRLVSATNTNLGMVLLLAPMAAVADDRELAEGVVEVLESTTIEDASLVYRAIRLTKPGGLGDAPDQDVADEPSVTLLEAMRLAADRDLVARQYATGFADVFDLALPALRAAIDSGRPLEAAITTAYLTALAARPDTLIARKRGIDEAAECARRAGEAIAAGWPETPEGRRLVDELDVWLRTEGHSRNPGATADLIAAALFAALRDGTIRLPRPAGPAGWSND